MGLLALGPGHDALIGLHKASFVVWLVVTGLHVLAHLRRLPRLAFASGRGASAGWRSSPRLSLAAGALAVSTLSLVTPWTHWVDRDDAAATYLNVLM